MDDIEEDVDDSDVDDDSDGVTAEGGFGGFLHHTTPQRVINKHFASSPSTFNPHDGFSPEFR